MNSAVNDDESLKTVLERYRDRPFLFVEPGGNWGDHLIYRGAERLGQKIGLRFASMDYDTFMRHRPEPGTAIYLHGGGAFNFIYRGEDLNALARALQESSGPVIQGPHTAEHSAEYMQFVTSRIHGFGNSDFYLFARERTTWENYRQTIRDDTIKLRLDHDTALQLDRTDLLGTQPVRPRYDLLGLRFDPEQPSDDIPSNHFPGVRLDPARFAKTFDHWVRIHALSRSIITNRTHSAILSAILGVPATMLPGSYHKNRSIWEYSLRARGVKWLDWPEPSSHAAQGRMGSALHRLRHSHKLNQLRLSLLPLRGIPRQ